MKRKNTTIDAQQEEHLHPTKYQIQQDGFTSNGFINLSLSLDLNSTPPPPQQPPPPPLPSKPLRARRNPTNSKKSEGKVLKSKTVQPPYPWATDHRARVHTMNYLLENGVHTISGLVQCKNCERSYNLEYNLVEKFNEISMFIIEGQDEWHNRAPERWTSPKLPGCNFCGEGDSCKPLISEKKRNINWLFLFLGQFIGCCTLEQLKYFCKHTNIHRTGAKDRLIYLIYFGLCNQLQPEGPF